MLSVDGSFSVNFWVALSWLLKTLFVCGGVCEHLLLASMQLSLSGGGGYSDKSLFSFSAEGRITASLLQLRGGCVLFNLEGQQHPASDKVN